MGLPKRRLVIKLSEEEYQRFQELRECLELPSSREALVMLMDFYDCRQLDTLLRRLRQMYERGLTVREIRDLTLLATYLDFVLGRETN